MKRFLCDLAATYTAFKVMNNTLVLLPSSSALYGVREPYPLLPKLSLPLLTILANLKINSIRMQGIFQNFITLKWKGRERERTNKCGARNREREGERDGETDFKIEKMRDLLNAKMFCNGRLFQIHYFNFFYFLLYLLEFFSFFLHCTDQFSSNMHL